LARIPFLATNRSGDEKSDIRESDPLHYVKNRTFAGLHTHFTCQVTVVHQLTTN